MLRIHWQNVHKAGGIGFLATRPPGAYKLINIIERSVRSSHPGEETAKNDSRTPAPHPVWGPCGSCGAKLLSSNCGYRRILRRLLREVAEA